MHVQAAAAGEAIDWDKLYQGYNSSIDWPGAVFWREMADYYPDAKIILTMRPVEDWWKSYAGTIMAFLQDIPDGAPPHVVDVCNMMVGLLGEKTFGSAFDDEQGAVSAYEKHVAEVSSLFADDRLLCLNVTDGWEPLPIEEYSPGGLSRGNAHECRQLCRLRDETLARQKKQQLEMVEEIINRLDRIREEIGS